jgi:hypothetical protein
MTHYINPRSPRSQLIMRNLRLAECPLLGVTKTTLLMKDRTWPLSLCGTAISRVMGSITYSIAAIVTVDGKK